MDAFFKDSIHDYLYSLRCWLSDHWTSIGIIGMVVGALLCVLLVGVYVTDNAERQNQYHSYVKDSGNPYSLTIDQYHEFKGILAKIPGYLQNPDKFGSTGPLGISEEEWVLLREAGLSGKILFHYGVRLGGTDGEVRGRKVSGGTSDEEN